MKKKLFTCLTVPIFFCHTSVADTEQTVTVDGMKESKFVKEIVFSGDQITLIFEDDLSTTTDLESVNIVLRYTPTVIEGVEISNCKSDADVYFVDGKLARKSSEKLRNGVYIRNGKKFTVK